LAKLSEIVSIIRKTTSPMGGIQLILFGDFAQLGYIPGRPYKKNPKNHNNAKPLLFEVSLWKELRMESVELRTIYRQAKDLDFARLLNRIRLGDHTKEDIAHLQLSCIPGESRFVPEGSLTFVSADPLNTTKIFCHRNTIVDHNMKMLFSLPGEGGMYSYYAIINNRESFGADLPAESRLDLKVNALVVLTVNLDPSRGLVNGSRGKIISLKKESYLPHNDIPYNKPQNFRVNGEVVVRFDNGLLEIIDVYEWKKTDPDGVVIGSMKQRPLKLGWAFTVHKCQGMSLDSAELHLDCFDYGQAYAALSRVKTLQGLSIAKFKAGDIKVHPRVKRYYADVRAKEIQNVVDEHGLKFF
jgi:ATP-dependent DNA helicase PIF1